MNYKPLEVKLLDFAGMRISLRAMRLPKDQQGDTTPEQDLLLAAKLVKAGPDHAKFTRGIVVWLQMKMQAGFMIEFETYRHGIECLSTSSSMHNELKDLRGKELAEQKQIDLSTKVYTRIVMVSYQALRAMYKARRSHRHPDWQRFCDFCEALPFFDQLIMPERG